MLSEDVEYAVVAEGLSKRFRITRPGGPGMRGLFGLRRGSGEVWAVRHVSFEVARGEAVGILGRNGAGKSTLLEIIAGTRLPTEGRARVRGRVSALLQLGAGFHPEFTGRENVYLSGSIQGFTRAETAERFDEIAAFADIGRFLDQPVKTYSSGMYARLAFAAATAYQPDILIVDEILAVGDVDRDGDLDLFTTMWIPDLSTIESSPTLWLNDGTGTFSDATATFGLDLSGVASFTPTFSDVDGDGWPDLLLAADWGTSRLLLNKEGAAFVDHTEAATVGGDENGMGSVVADVNADGFDDWFVTSTYYETPEGVECPSRAPLAGCTGNRLYLGNGDGTFADGTDEFGVRDGGWGWGAAAGDLDNDGALDIVMTNGFEPEGESERQARDPQPGPAGQPESYEAAALHDTVRLWRGGNRPMVEMATEAGIADDGDGKALVVFDADGDGRLDVLIVNTAGQLRYYRNDSSDTGAWVAIRLADDSTLNRDGIGARVTVTTADGRRQHRVVPGGGGFQGQDPAQVHFGLGPDAGPTVAVEVVWPDTGETQRVEGLEVGAVHTVRRG